MSALGTRPILAMGLEGAAADESTENAPLPPQVAGDSATTTPAEAGEQPGSQPQQMVMADAEAHHHAQQAYGKMAAPAVPTAIAAPRFEEHRSAGVGDNGGGDGDDEVGEDNHLGAHTPDSRPWSGKEDDAITRMVCAGFAFRPVMELRS